MLAKITAEPPALPPVEHAGAHILNTPIFERKYAKAYLGGPESRDAAALRRQIAKGAREALEDQYWDVMERTIQARPMEARLGGDPSVANKVRAFLFVRFYKNGEWEDRIEVCAFRSLILSVLISLSASTRTTIMGQNILPGPNRPCPRCIRRGSALPGSH